MRPRLRWLAGDPALRAALAPLLEDPGRAGPALIPLRDQPGRRRLSRVDLANGDRLFLKHFARARGRHRVREAVKRALGLDAARREWRALCALHAQGVAVPEPRALARLGNGDCVLAMRFVEGHTLRQTLAERPRGRSELLRALADLVASLHAAGWAHRDLHHGNVVVGPGAIWLLDLQSALPLRARSAQLRDLGELDHSLAASLSLADRVRLRARALRLERPFSAAARANLRAVGRAAAARERAYARSRTRRTRRPGRRYARLRTQGLAGLRLRRIEPAVVLAALAAHARAVAGDAPELVQCTPRSSVSRVEAAGCRAVVKHWKARGPLRLAADCLRGSPARRAWSGGVGLRARRIGSATPFAFLERRILGIPFASWLVSEDLRPARPADVAVAELDATRVADALASLVSRLHRAGVLHGDLKASHVYLADAGGGYAAQLIDLEGVRFARRLSQRARIRELAELNASLPDAFPDALRCRAFARYRAAVPFRAPAQECLRRIALQSLARAHRWSGSRCALVGPAPPAAPMDRIRPGS